MVHRPSPPLNAARSRANPLSEQDASGKKPSKKNVAKLLHKRDRGVAASVSVAASHYQFTIFDYAAAIGVTLLPEGS